MKHTKDNCRGGNLFLGNSCGLVCGNCLACKCGNCDKKNSIPKEKLKHIASLTNSNNHGGARWYVADLFPYLAQYKRRFELIDKLHEIDGHLNFKLMEYRNDITRDMVRTISHKEGIEVAKEINNCL